MTIGGLPNAQGDPNFTRQLVQNDNGTLGYEPKVDLSTINLQKVLFNGGYANNNENNSLAFDLDNSTMYFNFRDETGTSVSAMSLNSTGTLFQQSRLLGESRFEMNKASDSITFYVRDSSNFPGSDTGLTVNAKAGLVYYNDYSSKFIDRSLVDKAYVDRTINNAVGGSDGGVWDFVGNVD
ncbi:hypothetical protein ACFQO9_17385 [Chryseobacterium zhengzhouense]|uniref:Flagellar hook protein FlgE n=1 Tax=Chryseobacterium zhengzhouense TaxID=1636086 RepID=A0ABW2M0Z0_9FLAO